jgi:alkaline phosphatase
MTQAALNVLDNDPDGFVLMIEGGAVDWAAHGNQSGRMIEEQIDFDNAVEAVLNWIQANSNWGETVLIVTGDHETGYLTGPMPDPANPTWTPVVNNGAGVVPGMQWNAGEHTNQLIPFYAKGDSARLFKQAADLSDPVHGPYIDNTDIAQVIFQLLR